MNYQPSESIRVLILIPYTQLTWISYVSTVADDATSHLQITVKDFLPTIERKCDEQFAAWEYKKMYKRHSLNSKCMLHCTNPSVTVSTLFIVFPQVQVS